MYKALDGALDNGPLTRLDWRLVQEPKIEYMPGICSCYKLAGSENAHIISTLMEWIKKKKMMIF